jgi:hypothetical protein
MPRKPFEKSKKQQQALGGHTKVLIDFQVVIFFFESMFELFWIKKTKAIKFRGQGANANCN